MNKVIFYGLTYFILCTTSATADINDIANEWLKYQHQKALEQVDQGIYPLKFNDSSRNGINIQRYHDKEADVLCYIARESYSKSGSMSISCLPMKHLDPVVKEKVQ